MIDGLAVTLIAGYYCLAAYGFIPFHRDPRRNQELRESAGGALRVLMPIALLGGLYSIASDLGPSRPLTPEVLAAAVAEGIQSQLPRQVDEFTILTSVEARGSEIFFRYLITSEEAAEPLLPHMERRWRADLVRGFCAPEARPTLELGVTAHLLHLTPEGRTVSEISITASDCAEVMDGAA